MLTTPLTFGTFARTASDRSLAETVEEDIARDENKPTAPEAHVAWLAGAPMALVPDERGNERFVSLLVPFL